MLCQQEVNRTLFVKISGWKDILGKNNSMYTSPGFQMTIATTKKLPGVKELLPHYATYYDCLMKPNARSVLTALGKIDHFELKAPQKSWMAGCWEFFCLETRECISFFDIPNTFPFKLDSETGLPGIPDFSVWPSWPL